MATKKLQLNSYRKSLLNRVTANASFSLYIENCLSREDEACKHSFHKVMVHNWSGTDVQLFETISEYFSSAVIPVQYSPQAEITSFYTSSLGLILKIIRQDFMFAFQRNMFNIDILFNDKTSADCFNNSISIDDIVSGVVSGRFNDKFVLDLSNFCNDPEFAENKISFYKLSLLAHFKILMLRMGRDTKTLNLSHNNLTQVPLDILNFFIKGDLTAINLSDNEIPSLQELMRVSSKIEKLWLEGNPLCEQLDPQEYVKVLSMKFPRLMELDGIRINEHGCIFPFYKNFLVTPDRKTKMVVEKFLTLYFTNYDSSSRRLKTRIEPFYDPYAMLTLNTAFTEQEEKDLKVYKEHSRNFVPPNQEWTVRKPFMNRYCKRGAASAVLSNLPPSSHDPSSFTVDVLIHNKNSMLLVVDGIYREKNTEEPSLALPTPPEYRYYSFRRSFVFKILGKNQSSSYVITNEMFSVRPANEEQIENSFKHPRRNLNELCLINPEQEESDAMIKAFMHITSLKKSEAEARLKLQDWDMKKALKLFFLELRDNKIGLDKLVEDDDFSDTSSLVDDEID